jgi:hypothetical protein
VVLSAATSFHFIDVGASGVTPGDSTTFTKVLKSPGGSVVGFGQGSCVILTTQKGSDRVKSDECQQTFRLSGRGTLQVDGLEHPAGNPGAFAVVGGTGEFRQAEGQFLPSAGPGGADVFQVIS